MDVSGKPMDNNAGSEEQQNQSGASDDKPGLPQLRKSWGFRRSTLARREFMEEIGDLNHSPPPQRRVRSRLARRTQASRDDNATPSPQGPRTILEDLDWSASSSPVSEETKPPATSAEGCLDPNMWQDFGSAFHTAFTLLGGDEDLSMENSQDLPVPDILRVGDATENPPAEIVDDTEVSELRGPADKDGADVSGQVAQRDVEDVILISSQEEDSDDMPLIQIKERPDCKGTQGARTRAGGRGKARGRGRGRAKAKGKARGRGRAKASDLEATGADDEDDDDVILVNPSDTLSFLTLSPVAQTSTDFIPIGTDADQSNDTTPGQYNDAPDEREGKQGDGVFKNITERSTLSDVKGSDPDALCRICRQKHTKRFMISCDSCQEYFHGDCVGVSESEGAKEYICTPCTTKQLSHPQPECHSQKDPEISSECLSLSPNEEPEGKAELESLKKTVKLEVNQVPAIKPGTEPEGEMKADCSGPLCIGPGCYKPALRESVYCGTDCIVQHATVTMKSLSDTKVDTPREQVQKKATPVIPTAKAQSTIRVSARLAAKAEELPTESDGTQTETPSSIACDPTLTGVQASPQPSPKFNTASSKECKQKDTETPPKPLSKDPSTDTCPSLQPVSEPVVPQSTPHNSTMESTKRYTSVETTEGSDPAVPPKRAKSAPIPASQSSTTSEHNSTGSVLNSLATYIIPKKQSGLQPSSTVTSCQKPSAPTLLNETRNLPVPPAPSAPPSRPSLPNNQVRQSIQRSLTGILSKRVCDCEELTMSESDAVKLVASIEMEMFDIFRNTDSKYMNKYRTIMFNLKDPKNKGLLYRVVQGDISPFRLVRMSQKDMQGTKAPDNVKDTSRVKDAKASGSLPQPEAVKVDLSSLNIPKPEAVKVDLPCLNITKTEKRPVGNKKSLPTHILKNKTSEPTKGSALPDVLTCMLKDTTSEHKAHLFDLKCKICTGQIGEDQPPTKKTKVSESSTKHFSRWRKSTGDDSPLRAPPDSPDTPDFDYSSSPMFDPSSRLVIDTSDFAAVESPASPIRDSPASPTLESPASPVMESPSSPDTSKTSSKRSYTPVVIPAVSTVTITRRDPRTAANRNAASSCSVPGPTNTLKNKSAPYNSLREDSSASSFVPKLPVPPTKPLPKSILMKPSSSADPRLYGMSSRNVISQSPSSGETSQFLAKQEVMWKGFLNMLTVSKFATKCYLVSGSAETLKLELPDSIEIGGRIMPQTVWEYVAKLKTNISKELCVIRFHPATEEEEVAYVSLFSYFSSRGRFGVVSNNSRSIKDVYIVPLSGKESVPSILQPLEGPGLEKNRPNLLLGLVIIQKAKRFGSALQEIEEKKTKVLPKDLMWIPKPPVLYGSDKLEVFQPYDPETPASTTPPDSPPCPGSTSNFSSNAEGRPSHLTPFKSNPTVSTRALAASSQSASSSIPDTNVKAPNVKSRSTISGALFKDKKGPDMVSNEERCTTNMSTMSAKVTVFSGSMMDPIVQQYGQKSKVKDIQVEDKFDRPYDPEEEYDPARGYKTVSSQSKGKSNLEEPPLKSAVDDDVAYDPEDETIFQDLQCEAKKTNQTKMSNPPSSVAIAATVETPSLAKTPPQTSSLPSVPQNLPIGTVVVSAATLTEQQRMLEELNKQIEEQKRQLKEQEEALRQQREAVGMFMAQFSASDSMKSSPSKPLPLSQVASLPSGTIHLESKHSESKESKPEEASSLTEPAALPGKESQTDRQKDKKAISSSNITPVTEQAEVSDNGNENDKSSSAGEIEDSDVPYDPEDDLFNEIQEDVFQGGTANFQDSFLPQNYASSISHHSRRRRSSPKRRRHRERGRCRSPSSQRSVSHSRKHRGKDRHRKSERDRSKHRRDHSERQARHRKSHSTRHHSHDRRRSTSSPMENDLIPQAPEEFRVSPSPTEKQMHVPLKCQLNPDAGQLEHTRALNTPLSMINTSDEHNLKSNRSEDFSQENVPNLKVETSQQAKPNDPLQNKASGLDNAVNVPSPQVNKQPVTSGDKFESSIPLREIDPPLRDSPESPDPDPRFVEPSVVDNNPSDESHKVISCQTQINNLTPTVETAKDCQLSVNKATLVNKHFEGTSNVKSIILRALNIWGSDSGERNVIKTESEGQKYSEILSQGGGPSDTTVEISTSSGPEISRVRKCPRPGGHPAQDPEVPRLKVDPPEQPACKAGVMNIGGSQNQDRVSDLTITGSNPGIKSKTLLQDSQKLGRDVNIQHQESTLMSNSSTCSDDRYLQTASTLLSDEKRNIEKCLKGDKDISMHRPGLTINYGNVQSSISSTGQDVRSAHHFKETQYDIRIERSVHSLDMTIRENRHGIRQQNVGEICSLGPGQGFSRGVDSHVPDRGIRERLTGSNDVNVKGNNKHDQCPKGTNENNAQQNQYGISNIQKANWRAERTGMGVNSSQSIEHFECKTIDWNCPIGDSLGKGQHGPDESKVHQPGWRGTAMENQGLEKRVSISVDPRKPQVEVGVPNVGPAKHDSRGPGGSRGTGPREGKIHPKKEVPVSDRRELGGPDFTRPRGDGRGPNMCNWNDPERLCTDTRIPLHDRRGPGGSNFRSQELNIGNPAMADSVLSGRKPDMEFQSTEGLAGSHFSGPGNERRRELPINCSAIDRNTSEYSNFRAIEPGIGEMGLPRNNQRGRAFKRSSIDGHVPSAPWGDRHVDELGLDRLEPSRPTWDPQSERGNPNREVVLHDWREPDIRGPEPERNHPGPDNRRHQPFMEHRMVERRGERNHSGPDNRRNQPFMEHKMAEGGPERNPLGPDIRSQQPFMEHRMPEARIPNRPGNEHLGPNTDFPGPDRRHPDRQEMKYGSVFSDREPGPDKMFPQMRGPECNRRSPPFRDDLEYEREGQDFRGPVCEIRDPHIEGLGSDRREPEDNDFQMMNFERDQGGPGPNWRENGPSFMGPGNRHNDRSGRDGRQDQRHRRKCQFKNSHQAKWKAADCRYPAPDCRGADAEIHWPDERETHFENDWDHHDDRYPQPFPERNDDFESNTEGPFNARRGPMMRERGHIPDRTPMLPGPRRSCEDDWGGPGFRNPRPCQDNDDMMCARPDRLGPGNDFRESGRGVAEPRWGSENMDCRQPSNERRVPGSGSDRFGVQEGDRQSQRPRGPSMERPWPEHAKNNSFQNRREVEMQDSYERRGMGDADGRYNENPYDERVGDARNLHPRAIESKRDDLVMNCPSPGHQGSEPDFMMQDSDMRGFTHNKMDMRGAPDNQRLGHGPGGWDTDTEVPTWTRRGEDKRGPVFDSREPDSNIRNSRPYKRGLGIRGRGLRPKYQAVRGPQRDNWGSSENPRSQAEIKTPKPRAGLLPTPTVSRLGLPNHKMNNPNMLGTKQKQNRPPH
ncbi:uncharacterized protein si:ch73-181d5.4 isoform X1 [Syngnathus typhle]|uniref:uncharacterized protein si:ch73-181d5.4 isoform X1 n=1 Tax=Syngnathus typhle TaxID=161592 RepID=UPI002A6B0663|nr:uncharacterized protein si:ch73-181d5.4 isoform X1 [Syngnathus typhle]XP_061128642.1 uncharacterized protein si:ch73-181d5.4 isoform X1 [Syngnathus typhle]